jgi:hypothetical protein
MKISNKVLMEREQGIENIQHFLAQHYPLALNQWLFKTGKMKLYPGDKVIYPFIGCSASCGRVGFYHGLASGPIYSGNSYHFTNFKDLNVESTRGRWLLDAEQISYLMPYNSVRGQNYFKKHTVIDQTNLSPDL